MRRFWIVWIVCALLPAATAAAGTRTGEVLRIFDEGVMVMETLEAVHDLKEQGNRREAVALMRAVSGELEKRWVESLVTNPSSSAGLAAHLAKAQADLGDAAGQTRTIERIDAMLERSSWPEDRCIANFFLAEMWMDIGRPEKARELLDEALEIGRGLPRRADGDRNPRLGIILSVAGRQAEFGWHDLAAKTLREIAPEDEDERQAVANFRAVLDALRR